MLEVINYLCFGFFEGEKKKRSGQKTETDLKKLCGDLGLLLFKVGN